MINRRLVLRGLVAAPAVVAVASLMPVRGIIMPASWHSGAISSAEQMRLYQGLYDHLGVDGVWDKPDRIWLFGWALTEEEALTDLVGERAYISAAARYSRR